MLFSANPQRKVATLKSSMIIGNTDPFALTKDHHKSKDKNNNKPEVMPEVIDLSHSQEEHHDSCPSSTSTYVIVSPAAPIEFHTEKTVTRRKIMASSLSSSSSSITQDPFAQFMQRQLGPGQNNKLNQVNQSNRRFLQLLYLTLFADDLADHTSNWIQFRDLFETHLEDHGLLREWRSIDWTDLMSAMAKLLSHKSPKEVPRSPKEVPHSPRQQTLSLAGSDWPEMGEMNNPSLESSSPGSLAVVTYSSVLGAGWPSASTLYQPRQQLILFQSVMAVFFARLFDEDFDTSFTSIGHASHTSHTSHTNSRQYARIYLKRVTISHMLFGQAGLALRLRLCQRGQYKYSSELKGASGDRTVSTAKCITQADKTKIQVCKKRSILTSPASGPPSPQTSSHSSSHTESPSRSKRARLVLEHPLKDILAGLSSQISHASQASDSSSDESSQEDTDAELERDKERERDMADIKRHQFLHDDVDSQDAQSDATQMIVPDSPLE